MIDVLVFDGCEALDALGPAEVLAYGGLGVRVVAREGARSVRTAQGLELQAGAPREVPSGLLCLVAHGTPVALTRTPRRPQVPSVPSLTSIISEAANWPRSARARCGSPTPD